MGQLDGKVAVVTGANRGIGRVIALALARAGAAVAVSARRAEDLDAVVREVRGLGRDCLAAPADLLDEGSLDTLAGAVAGRFGTPDVVVANAAIAGPTKPMQEVTLAEWRECLATDLDGVFLTFRAFVPGMMERRSGSLIAISSMTGKRPLAGRAPYAAAKLGVIGLCRTLALELGPFGVRVNSVCPGAVSGARIKDVVRKQARLQGVDEEVALRQFTGASPLGRLVEPDEVAAACVYLASDASGAVTGEDLNVTAGTVMY
jgi:NAD(P)-dependent dehydrogenase (short-subunit alcohol dehydrogenase family)